MKKTKEEVNSIIKEEIVAFLQEQAFGNFGDTTQLANELIQTGKGAKVGTTNGWLAQQFAYNYENDKEGFIQVLRAAQPQVKALVAKIEQVHSAYVKEVQGLAPEVEAVMKSISANIANLENEKAASPRRKEKEERMKAYAAKAQQQDKDGCAGGANFNTFTGEKCP